MKLLVAVIVIGAITSTALLYHSATVKNKIVVDKKETDRRFTDDCWPNVNKGR
jgi:hypothetical protein